MLCEDKSKVGKETLPGKKMVMDNWAVQLQRDRGNTETEAREIFREVEVESELYGIDCYKLVKKFNKLMIKYYAKRKKE